THESQREQIEGQRRLQEDVTAIHDKMEALQGNRRLVASNLPPLPGVAPRLPKQRDIEAALAACRQGTRIVALHGLGGYGKSTLAMLHATNDAARSRYRDRRWIVSCENRKLEDLLAGLLVPAADTASLTVLERAEIVRTALQEEPSLVILDNVTDEAQWRGFLESGLLNCPSLDVIVTCREPLKRSVGGSVAVDRLASEEIRELLGSRRPEVLLPAHAAALATIERETEGMALLVAAVAAIIGDDEVDVDDYARSLEAMPLEALPAADEDGLPYPKRAGEILADFHRRLPPAMRRIVEYSTFMLPDLIEREWLEWLLLRDSGMHVPEHHRIELGSNSAGESREPAAIVREAIKVGLLRTGERVYYSGRGACLLLHRLHRKESLRRLTLDQWRACWDSMSLLLSWIVRSVSLEHDAQRELIGNADEDDRRFRILTVMEKVDLFVGGVCQALRDSVIGSSEADLAVSQLSRQAPVKGLEDVKAADKLASVVINRIEDVCTMLEGVPGLGNRLWIFNSSWRALNLDLSWVYLQRGHVRAASSWREGAESDYEAAWRFLVEDGVAYDLLGHAPIAYASSHVAAQLYRGEWALSDGRNQAAKRLFAAAIELGEMIRVRLSGNSRWERFHRDHLVRSYRGRAAVFRAAGDPDRADADDRHAAIIESAGDGT
ncbi:MAG: NB-ARC domain-containing protein, partial [Planctomycetaceae bacterium]